MNKQDLEKRKIAYFTMEVGIDPKMPTYSGGLGVLAGDTIKSCADYCKGRYRRNCACLFFGH